MSTYSWGRLYGEWADDIKVQSMSEADQRRHAMLLCMHIKGHTNPTDEEVVLQLRISMKSWKKTREIFLKKGFISGDGNHLNNWERRQYKSDKSAERTRDYRNRKKKCDANVTSQGRHGDGECDGSVTGPEYRIQNTDTEEEKTPLYPPRGKGGDFDRFWAAYPGHRKTRKPETQKKFEQLRKSGKLPPIDELLAVLARHARSPGWLKQNGEFIPGPLPWLNQSRWLDDIATTPGHQAPPGPPPVDPDDYDPVSSF